MKEIICVLIIGVMFACITVLFYRILLKSNGGWFAISSILYLVTTGLYFDFLNFIINSLRIRQIYLEFGHADLLLIELMVIAFLAVIISICFAYYKKEKIRKGKI